MEMRTFEGVTLQDAIKSVKRAFGSEAVILSTKEKKLPGNKAPMYEVTAAAPSSRSLTTRSRPSDLSSQFPQEALTASLNAIESRLVALQEHSVAGGQMKRLESGLHELKMLLVENIKTTKGSPIRNLPAHLEAINNQLQIMGVDSSYVLELVKYLRGLPERLPKDTSETPEDYYRGHAIRWMLKRIKIAPQWAPIEGSPSVHVLVGTTGVGKTSTVAKLTAHFQQKRKYKVQLVSLDNKRLAGSEQLRVYSKILGASFSTIDSPAELEKAILASEPADIVLVDTAGINPKSVESIQELKALRKLDIPLDIHVCLSVTEKESQQDQSVKAFSEIGIQSLIFSKLDEGWNFGEIFNVAHRWSVPLSYFSIGQKIPEDLERASRERVIERIFGL